MKANQEGGAYDNASVRRMKGEAAFCAWGNVPQAGRGAAVLVAVQPRRPSHHAMPASAGVLVMSDSACTGLRSSSSRIWYTRRCRLMLVSPSNRADTTSTLKCVSPLYVALPR